MDGRGQKKRMLGGELKRENGKTRKGKEKGERRKYTGGRKDEGKCK